MAIRTLVIPPYNTGTEMDMETETSPAKVESLTVAEFPAKAYPTPNPP